MTFIRLGDRKILRRKRKRDINIVDELKDLLNEHINRMCVTDDVEELKKMKKWSIYCIEKIYDFNYKRLCKSE